ncbi:MAG: hypothetical protein OEZ34_00870 [Spirochaetia bacterium]|nr:hypothetical protein [Spirochaetia bacterium]
MKIGEYLIQKGQIKREDMEKALEKQKEDPNHLLGEILVSMGAIDTHDLFSHILSFVKSEGTIPDRIRVWISQDEIDRLIQEYEKSN